MDLDNARRYIQLCSMIEKTDANDLTEFLLWACDHHAADLVAWACEHFDIVFQAWVDIKEY